VHHSSLVAHECGHTGDNGSDERARKEERAQQDEARYPTHHPRKSVLQVSLEDGLCNVRNPVLDVVLGSDEE